MNFRELYDKERQADKAVEKPSQAFIARVMQAACATESTVRSWLCGSRNPDRLAKEAIAAEFGMTVDELFPSDRKVDHEPYPEE